MLHLGHLGPGLNHQVVYGAGVEDRVPGPAQPLTHGVGPPQVDGAAGGADDGLGLEHVDHVLPDAETDGSRDPAGIVGIGQKMRHEDALVQVAVSDGGLGGLGHDGLVGLAVDHDLPAPFADVAAFWSLEEGQAPLLEHVDRGIHVPGDIEGQVFPG